MRIEQAYGTIGDENSWRMASGSKGQLTTVLRKTRCRHGEVEPVDGDTILHEVVKALQQGAWRDAALESMEGFGIC